MPRKEQTALVHAAESRYKLQSNTTEPDAAQHLHFEIFMIDAHAWMRQAVILLKEKFGPRLLFVGLQGSYRRGEAREDSDIDILTILDTMGVPELTAYREVLNALPEGEKAGGFTCGRQELLPMLSGNEAELLRLSMHPTRYEEARQSNPDRLFRLLLDWSGSVLPELAEKAAENGE